MWKKSILTALFMMGVFSVFGSALDIVQTDANHAAIAATDGTNILISGNFSENTRITPNFIPFLNGTQSIEIQYDKSKPFSTVGMLTAKSDNSTVSAPFNITVPANVSFSLSQDFLQINSSTSENGTAYLYLDNKGNVEANITVNKTGNLSQYLYLSDSLVLGSGRVAYQVGYVAPNATGNYYSLLNFSSGSFTRLVNLSMSVSDTESPQILNYTFAPEMLISNSYPVRVRATDNVNISAVSISSDNFYSAKNATADGWYLFDYTPKNYGTYTLYIKVKDTSGNSAIMSNMIKVVPMNGTSAFEMLNNMNFGTLKYNTSSVRRIFFRTENPANFTVNKTSFSISNEALVGQNASAYPDIELLYGDSSISMENLTSLEFRDFIGGLAIEVKPNSYTFGYSGSLKIELPDAYNYSSDIRFSGAFGNYTVCNQQAFNIFQYPLTFTAVDTGVYETSRCLGQMSYPIDFNTDNALVVVQPSERQQIFSEQNAIIKVWQNNTAGAWEIIWTLVAAIGISAAGIFYLKIIYPKQG